MRLVENICELIIQINKLCNILHHKYVVRTWTIDENEFIPGSFIDNKENWYAKEIFSSSH